MLFCFCSFLLASFSFGLKPEKRERRKAASAVPSISQPPSSVLKLNLFSSNNTPEKERLCGVGVSTKMRRLKGDKDHSAERTENKGQGRGNHSSHACATSFPLSFPLCPLSEGAVSNNANFLSHMPTPHNLSFSGVSPNSKLNFSGGNSEPRVGFPVKNPKY